MAFSSIYSKTDRINLTHTGNTLVLNGGAVGGFYEYPVYTSLDTSLIAGAGYPGGTTTNWKQSGSSSVLNIPPGATVEFAYLQWFITRRGATGQDGTFIDTTTASTPITFTTPSGTNTITPDAAYNNDFAYYVSNSVRGKDVTSLVSAAGSGTYSVQGVIGTGGGLGYNKIGNSWTLFVVYKDPTLDYQTVNLYRAGNGDGDVVTMSNFKVGSPQYAKLHIANVFGETIFGDNVVLTVNGMPAGNIGDATHPIGNFNAGIIANDNGVLDTSGSFGTANNNISASGNNPNLYARQTLDITAIDLTPRFPAGKISATLYLTGGTDINVMDGLVTSVDLPDVEVTKSVDKTEGLVGDVFTYTVTIQNKGTMAISNVKVKDVLSAGMTFNAGSVVGSPTTVPGSSNPTTGTGVAIPSIAAGATQTITYKATATNAILDPNPTPNTADVTYDALLVPNATPALQGNHTVSESKTTNTVDVFIGEIKPELTKAVDKSQAAVGDVITYTVTVKNNGGTQFSNAVVTDIIPVGTTFVAASVKIDGVPDIAADPALGVDVGTVPANSSRVVTFTVTMNDIPVGTVLTNNATVDFDYTINGVTDTWPTVTSNNVTTTATYAKLSIDKAQSTDYAAINDVVTYSLTVKNEGNVSADNVIITDLDPASVSFVSGSVKIDGVPNVIANPNSGINIGTINPGASKVVTYDVKVNSVPPSGKTDNTATGKFEYTVLGVTKNGTVTSDTVTLNILDATLVLNKSVNPANASIGDEVTYTVTLQNTGNTAANLVVLKDILPTELTFKPSSVIVNGTPDGTANPSTGINIATIAAGSTTTVTFKATVNAIPPSGSVVNNTATSTHKFTVDPAKPNTASGSSTSNISPLNIGIARTILTKSVDKAYADIGDVITYTVDIKNTGNVNANNVIFTDAIPVGTTLVPDSFTINGTPQIGVSPQTGTNIGTVAAGATVQVTFKVNVNTIPTPNPIPNSANTNFEYSVGSSNFTGGGASNTVTTQVNHGDVNNLNKTTLAYAAVGDTITYTIVVPNVGNVAINNVILTDIVPSAVSYVPGTVKVNGLAAVGTPSTGITVGTIAAGGSSTVTFDVKVNSIPDPNPMQNQAEVAYTYTVDPAFPNNASGTELSNFAPTTVNFADLIGTNGANFKKTVDKAFAKVGDTLLYTITLANTGNVPANNIVVTDVIPAGAVFVPGSILVNGGPGAGAPNTGITVPSIPAGGNATVSFNATVTSIPVPNPINNTASVAYKYTVDPAKPNAVSGSGTTNIATTQVNFANISGVKAVDKASADLGDVLTYTITLTNSGNTPANNVTINDTLPSETSFVVGSVTVAGSPQPLLTPASINVGSIAAGASKVVTYKATVNTIPITNPIINNADINYTYTVNPSTPNGESVTTKTTDANTTVGSAKITMVKDATPVDATKGDVITYTITLTNTGNVAANNILFKDVLEPQLSFVPSSVVVGGVPDLVANPVTGFIIPSLAAGASVSVIFTAEATSVPVSGVIVNNKATTDFKYTVDPAFPNGKSGTAQSNVKAINLGEANIDMTKTVDKAYADVGDILTYIISLPNTGNVTANNVIFTDLIPSGTSFVADSLLVNGVQQIGANPAAGYNIGSIPNGSSVDVEFKVLVDQVPVPNPIVNNASTSYGYTVGVTDFTKTSVSNQVSTQVNHGEVKAINKTAVAFATLNQIVTYTIKIPNTGNVSVNQVILTDIIPANTEFVIGSVKVNGNPGSGTPSVGIPVGTIAAGATSTVTFDVKVKTYPPVNPMINTADVTYKYTVDPAAPNGVVKTVTSNEAPTTVNFADLIGDNGENFTKTVDKAYAKVGDIITYTLILKNTGNVFANNIVVTDIIPAGATFIPGSLLIAGTPSAGNPAAGISVPKIAPGQDLEINFSATVDTIPVPNPIVNKGNVVYKFTIDPAIPNGGSDSGSSNEATTQVNFAKVTGTKDADKANADVGEIITYTITLTNTGNQIATNITVADILPPGTAFVPGTVTVNGLPVPAATPNSIIADDLIPNAVQTVTYEAIVTEIPVPNPIVNNADVTYSFTVDPANPNGETQTFTTTNATTQVKNATITMVKNATPTDATIGTTVNYVINLSNTGNVAANNILFKDILPPEVSFIAGTVSVAGVPNAAANPVTGFTIPTLAAGSTAAVSFLVKVIAKPASGIIASNYATADYKYTVDPAKPNGDGASAISNVKDINIGIAQIGMVKEVDKEFATIGDIINYTVTISNTGNVVANNVIFTDAIPAGTSYVLDSLAVNGIVQPGANPGAGYNIGSIPSGGSSVVTFSIKVDSLPAINPIVNSAASNFSYTVGNTDFLGSAASNKVSTKVNFAEVKNVTKTAVAFATLGQVMTYTIKIPNTGNVAVNNVIVTDIIPSNTEFVVGSAKVNGVATGGTPAGGIVVGTIAAGTTTTVTFDIVVKGVANPNPMINNATVDYSYVVDPNEPAKDGTAISSNAVTTVNFADLIGPNGENFVKVVDKSFAKVGDVLTYTLTIKNTGNTAATSVNLKDVIPAGTSYVAGSLLVNGAPSGGNINTGIVIPNIPANQTSIVVFQVHVNTLPAANPIPNKATINYKYTADANNPNTGSGSGESNTVTTQINFADVVAAKVADKAIADIGSIITYTINLTNNGNVAANNVIINDILPPGVSFVAGSVIVAGVAQPAATPANVNVGTINAGATKAITYKVKVTEIPNPNPIVNNADVNYKFTVNPLQINGESASIVSTDATTKVENATLIVNKESDGNYFSIGDTVVYIITLENTGNIAANNVFIKDVIPAGVNFVPGTVVVNGVANPAANPIAGFNAGNINAGQTIIISYNALVTANPATNPVTNKVSAKYEYGSPLTTVTKTDTDNIEVYTPIIDVVKSSDVSYATVGDEVNFTFVIKNTGNTPVNNFNLQDAISEDLEFVVGSVKIDGVSAPLADPTVGVNIPSVADGSTITVTFKTIVKENASLNDIVNFADYDYTFTKDPGNPNSELGEGQTNTITIKVSYADLTSQFSKAVNKQYADINEDITYIIKMTNTGNKIATNVVVTDPIPTDVIYVPGTLVANVPIAGSPSTGIVVTGGVAPGQTVTITYKVRATKVPATNPIPNTASIKYNFTKDPADPNGESGLGDTNTVTTKINTADLLSPGNFVKTVDKAYADFGEEITFTINVKNNGNVIANNVLITDPIPAGTSYVAGSLTSNVPATGVPATGITITGGIAPGQIVTLTFKVLVDSIPVDNLVRNKASISYSYTSNPSQPNGKSASGNTNETVTEIRHGEILAKNAIKSSNKVTTAAGDTITYSISGTNTGNADVTNVIVKDTLQAGTEFVLASVIIDGVSKPLENPTAGINVGTVAKGASFTITFKVKVLNSTADPILNTAQIDYGYTVDPQFGDITNSVTTNTTKIKVLKAKITMQKTANTDESIVGEIVRYTVIVSNTGDLTVNNVIVTDLLDSNLSYQDNLTINGVPSAGDITAGLNIGTLNVGQSKIIEFDVKVESIPINKIISNKATASFTNTVSGVTFTNKVESNTFDIKVYNPKIEMTKTASKKYLKIGDIFVYTINIKNAGDIDINDVILTDIIPTGLLLQGITVDGIAVGGNLATGINIGDLAIGQTKVIKLTIKVVSGGLGVYKNVAKAKGTVILNDTIAVTVLDDELAISEIEDELAATVVEIEVDVIAEATDIIGIQVFDPQLTLTKSVNKPYAAVGEIVTYTVVVENTGDVNLGTAGSNPIKLFDVLDGNLKFVDGSVKVDGVADVNASITNGINLGTMAIGTKKVVTFDVEILSNTTSPIKNTSNATFGYLFGDTVEFGEAKSNTVEVIPEIANLEIVKTADKNFVVLGEEIEYTVIVKNTGTLDAYNVNFTDTLPGSLTIVDGSFSINGQVVNSVDVRDSINIGTIKVGESVTIKYKAKVTKPACKGKIINAAMVEFNFRTADGRTSIAKSDVVSVSIDLAINTFKQISIDKRITIPERCCPVEDINSVDGNIVIEKAHVIKTLSSVSNEGQILTGRKLVVSGKLNLVVEYTELVPEQSVHVMDISAPLTTFVVLNAECQDECDFDVNGIIEGIYFKKINDREIFVNVTMLVNINSNGCCK